ncbi:E3 ubiquitin-protein ligase RFWD3-like [Helicoverpa zea]|uniref:E3 ubiquitin-protein ligase RFWD3-like n=1 Tax=Helicoverpa zea TaxID=7113 RepID=UPI001F56BE41|nr:E3 ubiquitin-protein ligase RFWD3-like [Helicoverpa zea]XP_047039924.1 E3 ubiquitin-protein ligase RFWD3-like [Helicoverpa zea]XP_047039925.1 E3 ubiquitin-protein ligase RFWD3-like [Helicoverpa zea]
MSISSTPDRLSPSMLIPGTPGTPDFFEPEDDTTSDNISTRQTIIVRTEDAAGEPRVTIESVPDEPSVLNSLHNDPNVQVLVPTRLRLDAMLNDDSSTTASITSEDSRSLPDINMRDSSNHEAAPPAKLRKINSPPRKVNSPPRNDDLDGETGETCPICLESWGNSGEHRLVALKCGHLFGSHCVERWMKAQPAKDRSCPTCKTKAFMRDIRFIYARKLVAADTSQITALQKQLDTLQAEKSRTELELQKTKIAHRACLAQLEELRNSISLSQTTKAQTRRAWRFALEKNLEICKDGGCRVLTYNCRTYELYVSQKSTNCIFPGYGIRKVSCVDYKLGQFVHLHPKPIRDMTYSQPRDLLLSVGLDSTARIVDRGIPSVTVQAGFPLWSCAWDCIRTNEFYVGGAGGMIHQYDFRNPSTCIQTLTGVGSSIDMSPVVSICSTQYGLMSCQLNSCWLWEANNGRWEPRLLPVEGSFMSLDYDAESHRAVIAVRPSVNGSQRSKLAVCKLTASGGMGEVFIDVEDTFSGSATCSLMSRATFARAPGASWVAAHSESDSTLYLHGLDGLRTMSLPAAEPAIDICSVQLNGNSVLAALSESRLRIYKAVPTSV